jgi:glycosyltransferase involved in cell wall biosynthesis
MRLLFVSPTSLSAPRGGRAMLARLHRDALEATLGDCFAQHQLAGAGRTESLNRIRGYLDGATSTGIPAVIAAIDAHAIDAVWLDGSNLGRLAQALRRIRPRVRIFTFFHNAEARFFAGSLRRQRTIHAVGVLVGNYMAERQAIRYSNDIVALSARDDVMLRRLYGRGADHILPMAVADRLASPGPTGEVVAADAPFLFVGGAFYANQAGIAWFARAVAPRIDARVVVVGQGMETMRAELEAAPNIRVLGPVDALEPHYRTARGAIAPIFDGSGMKTKVAEALMFGKRVIGTAEAWSGYEEVTGLAGWRCDTADQFVTAISATQAAPVKSLDPDLRLLYEQHYSISAAERRLAAILS